MTTSVSRTRQAITGDLESAAVISDGSNLARHGQVQINCHAVDANGDRIAASAGTGALEVITAAGTEWEAVLEDDNTTPEQFDFTAASRTVQLQGDPVRSIRVVPSDLAGTGVVGIRLGVFWTK